MEQKLETITLYNPINRKDNPIDEIQLRRPASGELRGLNLADVLQLEVDSLVTLLPRITLPSLTKQEVEALDPADLLQLGGGVSRFFLPQEKTPDSQPE
jgi:hypothetical protein